MNNITSTPLSDSLSNLCRDYGSFINWASGKIKQYPEQGWSDLTVSEPDTLTLSQIAAMHDYVQLSIDNLYVNTNPEISTEVFFRQLSAAMGLYTTYYNPHYVEVLITNNNELGQDPITIPAFSNFYINELTLTNPTKLVIPSLSSTRTNLVFGTYSTKIYSINKFTNGEIYINDNIEVSSLIVIGSSGDSSTLTPLTEESNIIALITSPELVAYQITYRGENLYRLKISPKALLTYKAIIVQYTTVNSQSVSKGISISYSQSSSLDIVVEQTSEFTINTRNSNLIRYYDSITTINEFNTSSSLIDFSELQGKISWYNISYTTNSTLNIPKLLLITSDSSPLTGSGTDFEYLDVGNTSLVSISNVAPYTYNLGIKFNKLPVYSLNLNYSNYSIAVTSESMNLTLITESPIDSVIVSNPGLGDLYKIPISQVPQVLNTETEILYEILDKKYSRDYPPLQLGTNILVLSPSILQLNSTVITSKPSSTINDILKVLQSKLLTQVITNTTIMYSQIKALILNNIPYISDITFTSRRAIIESTQYLTLGDTNLYQSQIIIKEGDE